MDPRESLRKRVTDPLEQLAQRVAERAIDLVIQSVDINEIVAQIDLNALIARIDVEALVTHTDFGEIIAKQTSGIASNALDAVRSQSVSLDGSIDRGVWRLVRRNAPRPPAPELLRSPAES